MYEEFYGLAERPFSLTPNPRYVFYSQAYRDAGEQLRYGIEHKESFMLVTGQPGTGKTTLCRDLLDKLDRARFRTALMFNPFLNGVEMLQALLTEFGESYGEQESKKELLDRLNAFLLRELARGHYCLAIFDEAQHLTTEFLEQIRVLSNLETEQEKLIQIILVGQPELLDRIQSPALAQLDQRVSVRCRLTDLDREQTERYVYHRLNVAGAQGRITFTPRALRGIYEETNGVPRLINLVCDRSLLAGFTAQTATISHLEVEKAASSLRGDEMEQHGLGRPSAARDARKRRWRSAALLTGVATAAMAVGWLVLPKVLGGSLADPRDADPAVALEEACSAYQHAMREGRPVAPEVTARLGAFGEACGATAPKAMQSGAAFTLRRSGGDSAPLAAAPAPADSARASAVEPLPEASETGPFQIQIAAFATREEAERMGAGLRQRGFRTEVLSGPRVHELRVGRYRTEEAAAIVRARLQESSIDGFILRSPAP